MKKGSQALIKFWDGLGQDVRDLFNNEIPNDILESAKAYDEMQKAPADDINEDLNG